MLEAIKNNKLYEIIMQEIKKLIISGELRPGDKLPAERELAEQLNVSRTSVREALKALETLGIIESKHGGGNYIKSDFDNILLEPLSIAFLLLGHNSDDVLEIRKIIEPEIARLAAKNITEEEILELNNILSKINNENDLSTCAKLDKEFHYLIAKAAQNHLLSVVMFSLSSLIEEYIEEVNVHQYKKDEIYIQHRDLLDALECHDSDRAFLCAKMHLMF